MMIQRSEEPGHDLSHTVALPELQLHSTEHAQQIKTIIVL